MKKNINAIIESAKDEWVNLALHPRELDEARATELVLKMYENVGLSKPKVHIYPSPFQTHRAAMKCSSEDSIHKNIMRYNRDNIIEPLYHAMIKDSEVQSLIEKEIEVKVFRAVVEPMETVFSIFKNDLENLDLARFKKPSNYKFVRPSFNDLYMDLGWVVMFEATTRVYNIKNPYFDFYKDWLKSGVGYIIQLKDDVYMAGCPKWIYLDEENRLHGQDSAAIEWQDGTGVYSWHGVNVEKRIIMKPETITKNDIVKQSNVEIRRCMREKLGAERYAGILGLEELNRYDNPRNGQTYILYRTQDRDDLVSDHLYFVKVVCPSTDREYMLGVPPNIRNAKEAVAWTFEMSAEEYDPILES